MAIKVSGTTVIDNSRNINAGIVTASSIDVPPTVLTFSPTDGSSDNSESTNIVLTYSATVLKGSGNIQSTLKTSTGTQASTSYSGTTTLSDSNSSSMRLKRFSMS